MAGQWVFYPYTTEDDETGFVFVDLSLRDADRGPLRHLVSLAVDMRQPQRNGLSSKEEYPALCLLEDDVVPAACAGGMSVFAGRTTTGGCRTFYFYSSRPIDAEAAANAAMARHADYAYAIDVEEDAAWTTYLELLHPSAEEMHFIMNRQVRDKLAGQGDDGSVPREIDHYVTGLHPEAKDIFVGILRDDGFTKIVAEPAADGFTVAFSRVDPADRIDAVSGPLFGLCEKLGATYGGWGCVAVAK